MRRDLRNSLKDEILSVKPYLPGASPAIRSSPRDNRDDVPQPTLTFLYVNEAQASRIHLQFNPQRLTRYQMSAPRLTHGRVVFLKSRAILHFN